GPRSNLTDQPCTAAASLKFRSGVRPPLQRHRSAVQSFAPPRIAAAYSGTDLVDRCHPTFCGAEAARSPHGVDQRVVDVEALGSDIHDLAGPDPAVPAGDGMEHA